MNNSECGKVIFKLEDIMSKRNMSKNKLSQITGLSFTRIQGYYKGINKRLDIDVLERLCHALDCEIQDIIQYEKVKDSKQ